ncbi:MATE family efflux transporter [Gemmiger sp.]
MKNETLFRTGSVRRAIFTMAVPSIIIIFVMFLYNIADMFFIGCLGDTAQVAAVSVVGPVFSILSAVATMLGAGGSAIIARCFGAKEIEQGRIYSSLCFWAGVALGVFVCAALLAGGTPMLQTLGSTPETTPYALQYLRILAVGAPLLILSNMMAMLVRTEGAVKNGLFGNLLGTVVNLVLDPLFILVFRWGVGGAAAASVLGNLAATGCYLFYIVRKGTVLTLDPRPALQKPAALGEILAIGLPNGISSLLAGFASTFSNRLLSAYGTAAIAAMAAAGKTTMLISMIAMALCMGCQPLLAYSYGAGDTKRLRLLVKNIALLTIIFGLAAGFASFVGRRQLIGMFIKEPAAAALGEQLVLWLVLGSPVIGLPYLATNLLQSANKAGAAVALSLLRQGLLLFPLLYGMNLLWGVPGIAAAQFAADTGSALIAAAMLAHFWHRELLDKE